MKAPLTLILLLILCPVNAPAWSGPIQFPELNYSQSLDAERQKKVAKALKFMNDDLEFINGRFFGTYSTQQSFGGTSIQTAQLIRLLRDAGIWNITLQFAEIENQRIAFNMNLNYKRSLRITINSSRGDFLLKDFAPFLGNVDFPTIDRVESADDVKKQDAANPSND